MKKYFKEHLSYYLTFGAMQVGGFLIIMALSGRRDLQMTAIVILSMAYSFWAIFHHYLDHTLTKKVVFEYVLFGVFGIAVSYFYFY